MSVELHGLVIASLGTAFFVQAFVEVGRLGRLEKQRKAKQSGGCLIVGLLVLACILFALSLLSVFDYFFTDGDMRGFPYLIVPLLFCPVAFLFWVTVRAARVGIDRSLKDSRAKY